VLLNNGDPIRLNPSNGNFSAIDLSFSISSLILPEIYNNDHPPIIIEIFPIVYENYLSYTSRWNLEKQKSGSGQYTFHLYKPLFCISF